MAHWQKVLTILRNEVGARLLPSLTKTLEWFKDFFIQNRDLISQGIVGLFVSLGAAMKVLAAASALYISYQMGTVVMRVAAGIGAVERLIQRLPTARKPLPSWTDN